MSTESCPTANLQGDRKMAGLSSVRHPVSSLPILAKIDIPGFPDVAAPAHAMLGYSGQPAVATARASGVLHNTAAHFCVDRATGVDRSCLNTLARCSAVE